MRTWDSIREDERGRLDVAETERQTRGRHGAGQAAKPVRRGMIRNLVIAVDCSVAMKDGDFPPSRLRAVTASLQVLYRARPRAGALSITRGRQLPSPPQRFMPVFFDSNPLSQVALLACRGTAVERLTDLSGDPKRHLAVRGWPFAAMALVLDPITRSTSRPPHRFATRRRWKSCGSAKAASRCSARWSRRFCCWRQFRRTGRARCDGEREGAALTIG